eukprot:413257-Rhodomonas_salina.1
MMRAGSCEASVSFLHSFEQSRSLRSLERSESFCTRCSPLSLAPLARAKRVFLHMQRLLLALGAGQEVLCRLVMQHVASLRPPSISAPRAAGLPVQPRRLHFVLFSSFLFIMYNISVLRFVPKNAPPVLVMRQPKNSWDVEWPIYIEHRPLPPKKPDDIEWKEWTKIRTAELAAKPEEVTEHGPFLITHLEQDARFIKVQGRDEASDEAEQYIVLNRHFPKGEYRFCYHRTEWTVYLHRDSPATQEEFEASCRELMVSPGVTEVKPDEKKEKLPCSYFNAARTPASGATPIGCTLFFHVLLRSLQVPYNDLLLDLHAYRAGKEGGCSPSLHHGSPGHGPGCHV